MCHDTDNSKLDDDDHDHNHNHNYDHDHDHGHDDDEDSRKRISQTMKARKQYLDTRLRGDGQF